MLKEGLRRTRVRRGSKRRTSKKDATPPRPGLWALAKATVTRWSEDRAPKMAAALAYYTAFALAPLLLIAIAVAGLVFGPEAARGAVVEQIRGLVGEEGGRTVEEILVRAWRPKEGTLALVLGIAALLAAATGVFGELQDSLNTIWKVQKKPGRGILGTLKDRFLSFSMVLGLGFLLLVSLVATAALQAFADLLTGDAQGLLLRILNFLVSFVFIAALFIALFKLLPDARTRWRDAALGGAATALLFTAGKVLIGLYLGRSSTASAFGAAGSFVVLLLWLNYSAQIVFLGAEFTKQWADRRGTPPRPDPDAVPLRRPA